MTANTWANTMELWNCSWSRRVIYWIRMRTSIPRLKQGPHSSQRCHIPEIQQHASLEQCFLWRSTLLGLPTTFKFLLSLLSKSSQNASRHHLMFKQFDLQKIKQKFERNISEGSKKFLVQWDLLCKLVTDPSKFRARQQHQGNDALQESPVSMIHLRML